MTIKIIRKGIDPKTIPLQGTCSNCKTAIECEESDSKLNSNDDVRDPRSQSYRTVECPVCKHSIFVLKKPSTQIESHEIYMRK